ncbi:sugar diacid utilization regulator [Mumia flava]|uniref:Sugar diacid utilization regulator n=1 Tax=Mumia flava TaxID=1348852 RepID=A0A2M9B7A4_9ACTN|nr:helix-turn-helix domain-containing protein [Mumia flava]PJJ53831.1 sugar diacid utilization regulator [Mumia flava]
MTQTARARYAAVLDRSLGDLTTAAIARMDSELDWFSELDAEQRSWISMIAHAGIAQCSQWLRSPGRPLDVSEQVFGAAPRTLTRDVSLQRTVAMVRTTIEVIESRIVDLFGPEEADEAARAMSEYAREVAFATAEVYARAAEARGAWDARLEALAVDAVVRGETEDLVRSRVAVLGWDAGGPVVVVVGAAPQAPGVDDETVVEQVRSCAGRSGLTALTSVQLDRLVVLLAGADEPRAAALAVASAFGDGPVVVGPPVGSVAQAHRSSRAAVAGYRAAGGWPDAPRPVLADELLVERALAGDGHARRELVGQVYERLRADDPVVLGTLAAYLEAGSSVEAAARRQFVHPNTVRYRLRKVRETTHWDPLSARGAYTLRVALTLGGLLAAGNGTGNPPNLEDSSKRTPRS